MNIYQRINEVRKACDYLRKEKRVDNQYLVIQHDQVTGAIRESLIDQGIIVVPNLVGESKMVPTGTTTAKGVPFMRYEATYCLSFVNMDEPLEVVNVNIEAHAIDHGDKAPGKAISYATKYAFLKLLSIETGEQEEDRPEMKPAPKEKESKGSGRAATVDAWDELTEAGKTKLKLIVNQMIEHLDDGADVTAYGLVEANKLDSDEIVALWSRFNATERSRLKKASEFIRNQKELEKK